MRTGIPATRLIGLILVALVLVASIAMAGPGLGQVPRRRPDRGRACGPGRPGGAPGERRPRPDQPGGGRRARDGSRRRGDVELLRLRASGPVDPLDGRSRARGRRARGAPGGLRGRREAHDHRSRPARDVHARRRSARGTCAISAVWPDTGENRALLGFDLTSEQARRTPCCARRPRGARLSRALSPSAWETTASSR